MSEDCNNPESEVKEESCSSPMNLTTSNSRYSPGPGVNSSSHSENAEFGSSQTTSPVSSTSVTPRKSSARRHAPYRLDQAVRKLTDRLEAKLENGKSSEEKQNGISHDESVEKSSPMENSIINNFNPQQLFTNNFFNPTSIGNPTPTVDPLTFLMLKNFANAESQNADVTNNIFQKRLVYVWFSEIL